MIEWWDSEFDLIKAKQYVLELEEKAHITLDVAAFLLHFAAIQAGVLNLFSLSLIEVCLEQSAKSEDKN